MDEFPLNALGKFLLITGVVIALIGLFLLFLNKIPYLGRLPGDILIQRRNFTFYFPITTLIVLNLLLLLISWVIWHFRK
ncbi:MAG: DUF2905 domain-containing protein [Calditrichaeota bacterium]|nr:MAG: DUF2905 domain-containing protein [Calditrichota bacterium]